MIVNKIPCEDCITFIMCKSLYLEETQINPLRGKCSLFEKWFPKYLDAETFFRKLSMVKILYEKS